MERTERLLDLVALLLDAREPISWAELRDAFPEDYQASSDEAAERKFERDKAELLELGIPIAYVQGDDDRKDGYVVDREAYYLPEVGLTPQEMAVLYAAGSAALASGAFPGRSDLAHALRKIGFFAGTEVPTPRVRMEWGAVPPALEQDLGPKLEELWNASATRKSVELSYYSPRSGQTTSRRVDPYGLAMRRGIWSLVGFCHLRKGIRTFHLHRIRALKVNPLKPKTPDFDVPNDFRLDEHVASYPWQHRIHPPVEVMLSLRGEISKLGPRLFPDARVHAEGSSSRVILSTTYTDGLLRYALSLSPDCSVLSPPAAVERWKQMAARILQTHETAQPAMGALA